MISSVFDGIGQCLHAMGEYEEALTYFDDSIKKDKDPNNVQFLRNRARCFMD